MCTIPTGKGICRKALMHQAQRTHNFRIGELAVEVRDLCRQQESFINDGAARERWDVKHLRVFDSRLFDFSLRTFANYVEFSLEGVFVGSGRAVHKNLLDVRLRSSGHTANGRSVDGSVPPAQESQPLFLYDAFENAFALKARMLLDWKKRHTDAVCAGSGQREAELRAFSREKCVRNLD